MIFDIHAHVIGLESGQTGNYLCPAKRMNLTLRLLLKKTIGKIPSTARHRPDEWLRQTVWQWISQSQVDKAVLLAMDGVYRQDGTLDLEQTQVIVSNDYVANFVKGNAKLLWGASIHPYRPDALAELDRAARRGACLVKWIPSAQGIEPDNPRCDAFYERLAQHGIPLLSHTGVEHALAHFSDSLNDPRRLEAALRRGVTVIAAHCGTRIYLYERSRFTEWARLAKEHPHFYGDLSAFGLPLHAGPLRRILGDPALRAKAVYGSDFPTPPWARWHAARIGWRAARKLSAISNPFDRHYCLMRAMGVPDEIFGRAESLLKLAPAPPQWPKEAPDES